ncbi:MAG: FtsK/SpoIIIE domain-containing protein, partial [Solirubrobacteraceae bacterium]
PELQRQVPILFDPATDGSMMVLGGPRSGKTTTLAMVAATLAEDLPVDDLHVYGLDCGGRALSAIEGLPHTGSVVPGDDGERTTQLLATLGRMLQRRRDLASDLGASHFDELRERASTPVPRVLVLVDDYGGFTERYERVESGRMLDDLRSLVSEGPTFGVHFVVSADRRGAIPMSVGAAITRRLVHRMADRDEYSRAGLPMKLAEVDIVPGRAFTEDGVEIQVATWVDGSADTLPAAIARRGAELAQRHPAPTTAPTGVAQLPALVPRAAGPAGVPPWHAFLGLRENELAPAVVNLIDGNFVVAGPYRSGRSSTIATIASGIAASTPEVQLHLIAPRRTLAEHAAPWTKIVRTDDPADVVQYVETLLDLADGDVPIFLAVDDATEVDPRGISGLEQLIKQARDLPMRVVIAADAQALRTSYAPWHVQMRKDGQGMLLAPNLETDGDLLGVRLPWRRALTFPKGRGILVENGQHELVQVAHDAAG